MTARVAALIRAFAVPLAALVSLVLGARTAHAWVELTVSNDDIHVSVEASGKAARRAPRDVARIGRTAARNDDQRRRRGRRGRA